MKLIFIIQYRVFFSLEQFILSYFQEEIDFSVPVNSNKFVLIYLLNIGYIKTEKINQNFHLDFNLQKAI